MTPTCESQSRSAREVAIKGEPSPAYARKKNALVDDADRKLLDRAEAEILKNPFHLTKRMVRADGTMADYNTPGVIIGFDLVDADIVEWHAFLLTMGESR